jgi:hypothetical protein
LCTRTKVRPSFDRFVCPVGPFPPARGRALRLGDVHAWRRMGASGAQRRAMGTANPKRRAHSFNAAERARLPPTAESRSGDQDDSAQGKIHIKRQVSDTLCWQDGGPLVASSASRGLERRGCPLCPRPRPQGQSVTPSPAPAAPPSGRDPRVHGRPPHPGAAGLWIPGGLHPRGVPPALQRQPPHRQ